MTIKQLFYNCMNINYIHAGLSADYAVRKQGNKLYIYFQHSSGKADWKNNLDFPAKAYKRMGKAVWFAHRGFLKVWKSIDDLILPYILDTGVNKIVICGYSHGAALALFCHELAWYNRPDIRNNIHGFGFGCPRVLWGPRFKSITKRWESFTVIRNIDDLVTHVPPFLFGYYHIKPILKIGKQGKYSRIDAHRDFNIMAELENLDVEI